ncbi:hypothetical protein [Bartonella rattaustraliani]|uniref:hypothetical protein n=1 Tax=Bartonella rattaustraliani TaxID=481139 RepID=UPI000376021A|nr:hypothetical protein [Bartonella rattaustraliani]
MTSSALDPDDQDLTFNYSENFAYMVALIQDEIDDTTSEYSTQIEDSIFTALRLCEREPFFFHEKKAVTFKTQSGKTWYGQEEGVFLAAEKPLKSVILGKKPTTQKQLFFKPVEDLQKQYGLEPPQGTPFFYTCCDQKIGLFPAPQKVETVRFFEGPLCLRDKKMMEEDDNPWLLHAFDLIKARAKYELYKNILKDPECAAVSFRDYQEQLQLLRFETSRRKGASNILPMRF